MAPWDRQVVSHPLPTYLHPLSSVSTYPLSAYFMPVSVFGSSLSLSCCFMLFHVEEEEQEEPSR